MEGEEITADLVTELRDTERDLERLQTRIVDAEELYGKWPSMAQLIECDELQERIIKLKNTIEENSYEH